MQILQANLFFQRASFYSLHPSLLKCKSGTGRCVLLLIIEKHILASKTVVLKNIRGNPTQQIFHKKKKYDDDAKTQSVCPFDAVLASDQSADPIKFANASSMTITIYERTSIIIFITRYITAQLMTHSWSLNYLLRNFCTTRDVM